MGWCRGKADGKADGKAGAGARLTARQVLAAGLTAKQVLAARLAAGRRRYGWRQSRCRGWQPPAQHKSIAGGYQLRHCNPKRHKHRSHHQTSVRGPTCDPPLPGASRFRRFRSYPTFPPAPYGPLRHPPPLESTTNSEHGLLPREIRPFTGRGRPCGRPLLEKPT